MTDTFKLADEVRAENRGEVWDPAAGEATPAPEVETTVAPEKVEETILENAATE